MPGAEVCCAADSFEGFSKRMPQFDGLRGFCAVMVIIHHYALYLDPHGSPFIQALRKSTGLFSLWVDMFFVLSGFLLAGILLENRNSANYFRVFYVRRILRIIPLYFVLLGVFMALKYGGAAALLHYPEAYLHYGHSIKFHFLMLQNLVISVTGSPSPEFLIPAWTVAIEEQFYMILPFFVRWIPEGRLLRAAACVIVSGAAAVVWVWAAVFSRRFFEGPLIRLGRRLGFNYIKEGKAA